MAPLLKGSVIVTLKACSRRRGRERRDDEVKKYKRKERKKSVVALSHFFTSFFFDSDPRRPFIFFADPPSSKAPHSPLQRIRPQREGRDGGIKPPRSHRRKKRRRRRRTFPLPPPLAPPAFAFAPAADADDCHAEGAGHHSCRRREIRGRVVLEGLPGRLKNE